MRDCGLSCLLLFARQSKQKFIFGGRRRTRGRNNGRGVCHGLFDLVLMELSVGCDLRHESLLLVESVGEHDKDVRELIVATTRLWGALLQKLSLQGKSLSHGVAASSNFPWNSPKTIPSQAGLSESYCGHASNPMQQACPVEQTLGMGTRQVQSRHALVLVMLCVQSLRHSTHLASALSIMALALTQRTMLSNLSPDQRRSLLRSEHVTLKAWRQKKLATISHAAFIALSPKAFESRRSRTSQSGWYKPAPPK